MLYPNDYAATHGYWVDATTFPDPATVPGTPNYALRYPNAPADIFIAGHRGLDTASRSSPEVPHLGSAMPLYAIEDGVVIETTDDDGTKAGTFVWGLYGGISVTVKVDSIKEKEVCYAMEHFSKRVVNVGDRVSRGQIIGYQGNTGLSYGAHCHTTFFVNRKYIDPTPYIFGAPDKLLRLKEVYADPIPEPQEDTTMGTLPQPIQYRYQDDSGKPLICRNEPGLTAAKNGQTIAQGEAFAVTAVQDKDGHSWAQTAKGWVSMGTPAGYWVTPVAVDTSALEATIADQANQIIALEHNLGKAQAETGRLGSIIDGGLVILNQK